jgi:hypothetical protein
LLVKNRRFHLRSLSFFSIFLYQKKTTNSRCTWRKGSNKTEMNYIIRCTFEGILTLIWVGGEDDVVCFVFPFLLWKFE